LRDPQIADAAVVAEVVVAKIAVEAFVFDGDLWGDAGFGERGGGRVEAERARHVRDETADTAAVPGVIDELIEDLALMSADGTKILQEVGAEVGEGLFFAGEDDDVGGGEAVGGTVTGGAGSALGCAWSGGEFRVGPIGLDLCW
jgi:hypothetical protein